MDGWIAFFFLITAALYAAVGTGGGSGYLAVMGLFRLDPAVMKPTALALNILVASLGTWRFWRAGHFSARLFWPIALASVPLAYLGGSWQLPVTAYRPLLGLFLFYAAFQLVRSTLAVERPPVQRRLPLWLSLLVGGVIGLGSGLMGIGGGIFLGPVLLLAGWADTRQALGVTAAFVLVNSLAGLLGFLSAVPELPEASWLWLLAAGVGGWVGAEYGSRRLDPRILRRLLALVLVLGSFSLFF